MQSFSTEEMVGTPCCVCSEPLPAIHHTLCEGCAGAFHFRMTETEQARDCGQIYMDDEACTTFFFCNPCYAVHILHTTAEAGG